MPGLFGLQPRTDELWIYCTRFTKHIFEQMPKNGNTASIWQSCPVRNGNSRDVSVTITAPSLLSSTHSVTSSLWFISIGGPSAFQWPCEKHLIYQSNHGSFSRHALYDNDERVTTYKKLSVTGSNRKLWYNLVTETVVRQPNFRARRI